MMNIYSPEKIWLNEQQNVINQLEENSYHKVRGKYSHHGFDQRGFRELSSKSDIIASPKMELFKILVIRLRYFVSAEVTEAEAQV